MREAAYYTKEAGNAALCHLCPNHCHIPSGKSGICRVRENVEGTLFAKTYGWVSAVAMDPIEKKPLNMFKPGSHILSVGTYGCNFRCGFCQNYHISQNVPDLEPISVEALLEISEKQTDSIGIAFTYNEPTIWYEYVFDVAKQHRKDTVLVTNGYICPEPLQALLPYISAMNIDLKSMQASFYQDTCGGTLDAVQETIRLAHAKTHVELTFLAIPGINDSPEETEAMAKWIAGVDRKIPLHIIPFHPMYQWTHLPSQTHQKIQALKAIAKQTLDYVF
ncbi:MAG: AmmeMemoRadiSam system radical SAM enzyme [Eubacteriales bacterium]